MKEIKIKAEVENLNTVIEALDNFLEEHDCPMKSQIKLDIAVEEIFVNIASYAYGDSKGDATIVFDYDEASNIAYVTHIDSGIAYNPLERDDPDITLSADERDVGGLGIYMVKQSMDIVEYEYKDKCNVFKIGLRL